MPTEMKTQVLIVDDHPIFRAGLRAILMAEPWLDICGEAATVEEADRLLENCDPDLMLLDLSLPRRSGIELLHTVVKSKPTSRVLVLSSHDPLLYAPRCLKEGARGFLEKKDAPDQLMAAVETVLRGEVYLSPRLATVLVDTLSGKGSTSAMDALTDRELNVFELLGRGEKPRDIADQLGISTKTVDAHLANIKHKLGLRDARELLRAATTWAEGLPSSRT